MGMIKEDGDRNFPIWLLGDSNPKNWEDELKTPFDSRHPIRHNIWTSVLDIMQEEVFNEINNRIDSRRIYIRNAVEKADLKPKGNEILWNNNVNSEVEEFGRFLSDNNPKIVLCFGAFAFEFARRAMGEDNNKKFNNWNTKKLGNEFRTRIETFDINKINIIPMLHRSIAGGYFLKSHNYFSNMDEGNYFEYVGKGISKLLLDNKEKLKVWKL